MNTAEQVEVQQPQAAVSSDPPAGQALVLARQAQNLSLADVANRLKLSVQQVQALEQGAYDRLPGPVFVRGFTRNYARLLKLDPEAAVRAVDARLPRAAAEQSGSSGETNIPMPVKNRRRWPVLAGIAAVIFLGAALVDVLWPETVSTVAMPTGDPDPPAAVISQAAPSAPPAASVPAAADASAAQPAAIVQAQQSSVSSATAAPAPGAVTANYQTGAGGSARTLHLAFTQQSWVQVRDASGTAVLEGLYPPGSSREVTARPPLTLVVGNAAGVRVAYGERAVDLAPHTRVAVARLTLE